ASLTQVSIRPKWLTASRARCSTWAHSATSVGTTWARPPVMVISEARSLKAASSREAITTAAPRSAKREAAVRPIPGEAPARTTTCSFNGFGIAGSLVAGDGCAGKHVGQAFRLTFPGRQAESLTYGSPILAGVRVQITP